MCAQAGEIPSSGETIVFSGYRFTVVSIVEVTTKQQYHFLSTKMTAQNNDSCSIFVKCATKKF